MFERYTEPARRTLFFARYEATTVGGAAIEPEHLLLGLLRGDVADTTVVRVTDSRQTPLGSSYDRSVVRHTMTHRKIDRLSRK